MTDKLILSIFDLTESWSSGYKQNGYPLICWDYQKEGCIIEGFSYLCSIIEDTGLPLYGLLAAPPCTDFAASGARWWPIKDALNPDYFPWDSSTEKSVALVELTLHLVDLFKPTFWALENPVGRIESLVPELKPFRQMSFDPCDYGDPYTKKTILWGQFNKHLPVSRVEPTLGSMMHTLPGNKKRAAIRSKTPSGFARAFYQANP